MLIPILIFGVLSIALIFFLIKSSDTWNWIPITFVALIFLTSIFGGIAASRSLKVRRAWKAQYLENEDTLARVQSEFDEALYGAQDTVDGYGEGSLRDTSLRLRLAQIGKGRVWEGGLPARIGEQYTLTYSVGVDENSPATQISQDMQLFAFEASDRVIDPGGGAPPAADFVGSFKVVNSDEGNDSVTIEPVFLTKFYNTGSLMRQLSAELSNANASQDKINRLFIELEMELSAELRTEFMDTWNAGDMAAVGNWLDGKAPEYEPVSEWALFEKMPGDSRSAFMEHAGLEPFSDDNPATPEKLAEYRDLLATTYLPAELLGLDPASAEYEELLDQYTFDGAKVNEINQYIDQNAATRVSDRFNMLANDENLFGLVQFNEQSEPFTVDSSTGGLNTDGRFNIIGEAIDPDLKLGKDVTFDKDTQVYLPKGPARDGIPINQNELSPSITTRNDADWLEVEYFKRPLRDYPFQLYELRELTRKASSNRRAIESDIAVTEQIISDTNAQIAVRSVITANLNADIDSMTAALEEINRLYAIREAQLNECKAQIQTYYNQIIEMYRQAEEPDTDSLDTSIKRSGDSLAGSSR